MLEISDPIHKTITLTPREEEIIDHPFMQRLRFIRQLGFVPLVYPSATHDRFSHALGTLHVSGLIAQQMFYNDSNSALAEILSEKEKKFLTEILRMSALLHDVGHAPFSHPAEKAMPPFQALKLPKHWLRDPLEERKATHEDYSVLLLAAMSEGKNRVIDPEEAEIIASLIHHKKIKPPLSWEKHFSKKVNAESLYNLVRLLISSDIDADRMDYLLRDSHFSGVVYGHFDLQWLISNLGVISNHNHYAMSISDSGLHALEHYLFARYNMYIQVYMHKTVKCFEYYFQRALDERETEYSIPAELEAYTAMRDATLIESLFRAAHANPGSWSARLMRREPAQRIARVWGEKQGIEKTFQKLKKDLAAHEVKPFLYFSQSKFLDLPEQHRISLKLMPQKSSAAGLLNMPVVVVRKQFGVVSAASLADYSFILKRYHRDITLGDIYVLRDEYEGHKKLVHDTVKRYRTLGSSEIVLKEEL